MPLWNPIKMTNGHLEKTTAFNLPVRRDKAGHYKMPTTASPVLFCTEADFLSPEADPYREVILSMIRERQDLTFVFATRKQNRLSTLPDLPNLRYYIVTEDAADLEPGSIKKGTSLLIRPCSAPVDLTKILETGAVEQVIAEGDERGGICDFAAVQSLKEQCEGAEVPFCFLSTGALFRMKGKIYRLKPEDQLSQAGKAGLNSADKLQDPVLQLSSGDLPTDDLFRRLSCSGFRSGFFLSEKDKAYVQEKGWDTIRSHAADFVAKRLAPAIPYNDGKQTPMRGHPVFPAQHATGCCCRSCLYKWHRIPEGRPLTDQEQAYIVRILLEWIRRQML